MEKVGQKWPSARSLRQHYLDQFFGSPVCRTELSAFVAINWRPVGSPSEAEARPIAGKGQAWLMPQFSCSKPPGYNNTKKRTPFPLLEDRCRRRICPELPET